MATIQAKTTNGRKYWYIVQSRRINGKPRPIVLAYLGKASALLKRLQGLGEAMKVKSYTHGGVAALLNIANELDVVSIINKYINSKRKYTAKKPVRNHLTAGMTFLLGAIGRACLPTSKSGFSQWAKGTSLEYLLRLNLSKVDSQHFWDLMDSLPIASVERIEKELIKKVIDIYNIDPDTLFFDTTNFYTYISSTNKRNKIAQRGRNKQKRDDLKQVGLAMLVTRKDSIPLLHHTYQGNMNDITVFKELIVKLKKRILDLGLNLQKVTFVFDKGNNSKENLKLLKDFNCHYVGSLKINTISSLLDEPAGSYKEEDIGKKKLIVFRDKRNIWGESRTILLFVSEKLKLGQIRGIYQKLGKTELELIKLKKQISNPRSKKLKKGELEKKINKLLKGRFMKSIIKWSVSKSNNSKYQFKYSVDQKQLSMIKDKLGFRILMTDRHDWDTAEIIKAYNGQAKIEKTFKNIKNPFHFSFTPGYHWTDHNIKVHFFICALGYLMASIIRKKLRSEKLFNGNLGDLFSLLNKVRLTTLLEESKRKGRIKAIYKLENMSEEEEKIVKALNIEDFHKKRPKFKGAGVYI